MGQVSSTCFRARMWDDRGLGVEPAAYIEQHAQMVRTPVDRITYVKLKPDMRCMHVRWG